MYDVKKWLLRDLVSAVAIVLSVMSVFMEWHLLLGLTGSYIIVKLFVFAKTYEYWMSKSRE